LLGELTIMHSRAELYVRFVRRRVMVNWEDKCFHVVVSTTFSFPYLFFFYKHFSFVWLVDEKPPVLSFFSQSVTYFLPALALFTSSGALLNHLVLLHLIGLFSLNFNCNAVLGILFCPFILHGQTIVIVSNCIYKCSAHKLL
jgi:hypothetical protein